MTGHKPAPPARPWHGPLSEHVARVGAALDPELPPHRQRAVRANGAVQEGEARPARAVALACSPAEVGRAVGLCPGRSAGSSEALGHPARLPDGYMVEGIARPCDVGRRGGRGERPDAALLRAAGLAGRAGTQQRARSLQALPRVGRVARPARAVSDHRPGAPGSGGTLPGHNVGLRDHDASCELSSHRPGCCAVPARLCRCARSVNFAGGRFTPRRDSRKGSARTFGHDGAGGRGPGGMCGGCGCPGLIHDGVGEWLWGWIPQTCLAGLAKPLR